MRVFWSALVFLALVACNNNAPATKETGLNDKELCVAAMSMVMKREPFHFVVKGVMEETVYIVPAYQEIGRQNEYRCRVEGDQIVWAAKNGRWMNGRKDPKISYSLEDDALQLNQVFDTGVSRKRTFSLAQLRDR